MLTTNSAQKQEQKQPPSYRALSLSYGMDYNKYNDLNNIDILLQSDGGAIKITETAKNQVSKMDLGNSKNSITIHCKRESEGERNYNNQIEKSESIEGKFIIYCSLPKEALRYSVGGEKIDANQNDTSRCVIIKVSEKDMDLLMLLDPLRCECSFRWLDNLFKDNQGASMNRIKSQEASPVKSNNFLFKQALQGALTKQQMKHKSLQVAGEDENSCKLKIIMGGQIYTSIYQLQINAIEEIESTYQFVEPGQIIAINNIEVINSGKMPSPYNQKIRVGVEDNKFVSFKEEDEVSINESIFIDQTYTIQKPLQFQIKELTHPSNNKTYEETAEVNFYGIVDRVNKKIPYFSTVQKTYKIGYPVILSQISVESEIRQGEEAPVAFSIWNRSLEPIGIGSSIKRLLNIRLVQKGSNQVVQFIPKSQEGKANKNGISKKDIKQLSYKEYPGHEGEEQSFLLYNESIDILQPNEMKTISGTIKIIDKNQPYSQKIELQAKLDLGCCNQQGSLLQNIQDQNFTIEQTKGYKYNPNSEFLVIYSRAVDKELIQSIKTFTKEIGKEVDLWDLSKDGGFSFDLIGQNNQKLCELYSGKSVIFLCALSQVGATNSLDQIQQQSFYIAAKSYSICTYIMGNGVSNYFLFNPNIDNLSIPKEQEISSEKEIYKYFCDKSEENRKSLSTQIKQNSYQRSIVNYKYSDSINSFTTPKEETIEKKCIQIRDELEKNNCYFYYLYYQAQITQISKSLLSKQFDLGSIKIVEGLRKDKSEIIVREENVRQKNFLDENDKYIIFKILSFETKIRLLQLLSSYPKAKPLIQSIFSDLANEYFYHQQIIQNNNKQTSNLKKLQLFQTFNFLTLSISKQEEDYQLNNILLRQKSIVFNQMNEHDKIGEYFINQLFNFRQTLLINKSSFINKYYLNAINTIITEKLHLTADQIKNKESVLPQDKVVLQNLQQQILNPIKEYRESSIQHSNQTSLAHISKQSSLLINNSHIMHEIQVIEDSQIYKNEDTQNKDEQRRIQAIEKVEKQISFEID